MTTFRSVIAKSIVAAALALGCVAAHAQYDAAKLRQVAGGYLGAVSFATQVKQSQCGYLFRAETDTLPLALADMVGYLSDDDMNELRAFIDSAGFRDVEHQQQQIVRDWLAASMQTQDEQHACETTVMYTARMYQRARQSWLAAKAYYGQ